ncbi:MAG TPA: threonine synthase [Acidobacteriota bacterium]|nr:threonine synthase [Acidobacteriota bacterium]
MPSQSLLQDLTCTRCAASHDADVLQRFCTSCSGPLYPRYQLDAARVPWCQQTFGTRPWGLWRYAELLPVRAPEHRLDLGEGGTPLLSAARLGEQLGLPRLSLKDEGINPTGSFKARGLCVAVSRARELGARTLSIPTAGNAGSALAAYCARGGLRAVVYMPVDTPREFVTECQDLGAKVVAIEGTIADAGAQMAADSTDDWFPVSTLQEPYRLEGKKTLGFELAEQLGWTLPDSIVYPTGGGTGLLGMWKAFDELETLGLIGSQRPRMYTVQAEGCAPIVRAFEGGDDGAEPWADAQTVANGLRVPRAFADREILGVLRDSGGDAIAVSDEAMLDMLRKIARVEGIYAAPEAAATLVAASELVRQGRLDPSGHIVCFLTGNAYKYLSSLV